MFQNDLSGYKALLQINYKVILMKLFQDERRSHIDVKNMYLGDTTHIHTMV